MGSASSRPSTGGVALGFLVAAVASTATGLVLVAGIRNRRDVPDTWALISDDEAARTATLFFVGIGLVVVGLATIAISSDAGACTAALLIESSWLAVVAGVAFWSVISRDQFAFNGGALLAIGFVGAAAAIGLATYAASLRAAHSSGDE